MEDVNKIKQVGSFAVEAAFVMLALTCLGLAYLFYSGNLVGAQGTCMNSTEYVGPNIYINSQVVGANGISGLISAANCKALAVQESLIPPGSA
jgi:hypothetical protein